MTGSRDRTVIKHQKLAPLRAGDLPELYLSIDPGSTHCGVARWEAERTSTPEAALAGSHVTTVRLTEVYERTPEALYIELRELRRDGIKLVLCEDFQLQKGRNLHGSRMETPKTIGVIEYLCRQEGVPCRLQSPGIKTYVDSWANLRGITVRELASNDHKRDGVRHGLYPALRHEKDRFAVRLIVDEHNRGRG